MLSDVKLAPGYTVGSHGFRPLSGIRCFRTREETVRFRRLLLVSVPFRGLDAFGLEADCPDCAGTGVGFRPLSGIRCFRTGLGVGGSCYSGKVSVPFRGLDAFGPRA